jgi:O-antigen ligase
MRRQVAASGQGAGISIGRAASFNPSDYWPRADVMLFVMMALVGVRFHEHIPGLGAIRPIFTLSIATIALLFAKSSPAVVKGLTGHPLSRLVFAYYGAIILTVPFALWRGGAVQIVQFFFPAVLLFVAFNFVPPTRAMLNRVMHGFVVIVLLLAAYLQTLGGGGGARMVIHGTFDSNDTASIFAMALPFAIGLLFRSTNRQHRMAAGLAIVALVLGVIATGSRGGTLALAGGAVVFLLGTRGHKALILAAVMTVGGAIAWATAPPFFRSRINSLFSLEQDYNTTSEGGRKAIWARARGYIRQHPIVGVGAGNFVIAEGGFNEEVGRTGKWSAAHNAYLQAFAELGAVGGGTFIAMLLTAAFLALRVWKQPSAARGPPDLHYPELLAGLVAFAIGATFLSHAYFHPVFAVIGMTALADRVRVAGSLGVEDPLMHSVGPQRPRGERGGFSSLGAPASGGQRGALARHAVPARFTDIS